MSQNQCLTKSFRLSFHPVKRLKGLIFMLTLILSIYQMEVSAQAGILDPSFGSAGKLSYLYNGDTLVKTILAPDKSWYVVTKKNIYKYNADGSADLNYGSAVNGLGKSANPYYFNSQGFTGSYFLDAALTPKGDLAAVYHTFGEIDNEEPGVKLTSILMTIFDKNGAIDPTFGGPTMNISVQGVELINTVYASILGLSAKLNFQGDKFSILIHFQQTFAATGLFDFYRSDLYSNNGRVDNGYTRTNLITGTLPSGFALSPSIILNGMPNDVFKLSQVYTQNNQRIIAITDVKNNQSSADYSPVLYLSVQRVNDDGSLDLTFGNQGKFTTDFNTPIAGNKMSNPLGFLVQSDEKMLFFDNGILNGKPTGMILRVLPSGQPDVSFDGDGFALLEDATIQSIAFQSDGKIVATGNRNGQVILARFLVNGSLDTEFGTGGIYLSDIDAVAAQVTVDDADMMYVTSSKRVGTDVNVIVSKHKNTPLAAFSGNSWLSPSPTSITVRSIIQSDGGSPITEQGFVYAPSSLNRNPEIGGIGVVKIQLSTGGNSLKTTLSGLDPNTSYHYKAYAINANGTGYSRIDSATTNRAPQILAPNRSISIRLGFRPGFDQADSVLTFKVIGKLFQPGKTYAVRLFPENLALGGGVIGSDSIIDKSFNLSTLQFGRKTINIRSIDFQGRVFNMQANFTINNEGIVTETEDAIWISTPENQTLAGDFSIQDADVPNQLGTYSLINNISNQYFDFNQTTGLLTFKNAPDREASPPGLNNIFSLNMRFNDDGQFQQTAGSKVSIQVENINEPAKVINSGFRNVGTSAALRATVEHDGGGGKVSSRGMVLSDINLNPLPVKGGEHAIEISGGAGTGTFTVLAKGLAPYTSYVYRAYALNLEGYSYSDTLSFTTTDGGDIPFISYDSGKSFLTRKPIEPLVPANIGTPVPAGRFRKVEHFAGALGTTGTNGSDDGPKLNARFNGPMGMVMDKDKNIYVADRDNHTIRKITQFNVITIAGSPGNAGMVDATGSQARFNNPEDLVISPNNDYLLVSDRNNHRIRRISLPEYIVTTVAGNGTASGIDNNTYADLGSLNGPSGIVMDANGQTFFVDNGGQKVRKLVNYQNNLDNVNVVNNSLHFDGADFIEIGGTNDLNFANSITIEAWIKVDRFDKQWQTIASKGDNSWRLSRSQNGNNLEFFTSRANGVNFGVSGSRNVNDGKWHHVAGVFNSTIIQLYVDGVLDGQATGATSPIASSTFKAAIGHNTQQTDRKWVGNIDEVRIWSTARTASEIVNSMFTPLTGTETGLSAYFNCNQGIAAGDNFSITTLINNANSSDPTLLNGVLNGFLLTSRFSNFVEGYKSNGWGITTVAGTGATGNADGPALTATFNGPQDVTLDKSGNLYILESNSHRLRKLVNGQITTLVGGTQGFMDGIRSNAQFNFPNSIVADGGGALYIADSDGNRIRKVNGDTLVTTFVGSGVDGALDSVGLTASFRRPRGLLLDTSGILYISDFEYDKIRKVSLNGFDIYPELPKGLQFNHETGKISGTAVKTSLFTTYINDFNSSQLKGGTLSGNARLNNQMVELTSNSNNQFGGLTIPASGRNEKAMKIAFTLRTSKSSGGADGMSYSFGPDASATSASPSAEIGSGSKLSLSFVTFLGGSPGIRLHYGAVSTLQTSLSTTLLAYTNVTNWLGKEVNVIVDIDTLGKASVYLNKVPVFVNISLPNDYLVSNKSSWIHVFKARTGGLNDIHAVDNISIASGAGISQHNVEANNYHGRDAITVGLSIDETGAPDLSPEDSVFTITRNEVINTPLVIATANQFIRNQNMRATSNVLGIPGVAGSSDIFGNSILSDLSGPISITTDQESNWYILNKITKILRKRTPDGIILPMEAYTSPRKVLFTENQQILVLDSNAIRILRPDGSERYIYSNISLNKGETVGPISTTLYDSLWDITSTTDGLIYVTDRGNRRIVRISPQLGTTSVVAGGSTKTIHADGAAATAGLPDPKGIAAGADGTIYFTDKNRIRKLTTTGQVVTIAGGDEAGNINGMGNEARFSDPDGLAVTPTGYIYVVDKGNHQIKRIDPNGFTELYAGSTAGFRDHKKDSSQFNFPVGITIDWKGDLLIADSGNHIIRNVNASGLDVIPDLPEGIDIEMDSTGQILITGTPSVLSEKKTYTLFGHNQVNVDSVHFQLQVIEGKKWSGEIDSIWNNQYNWLPEGVPTSETIIQIPADVPHFPHLTASTTVAKVNMDRESKLVLNQQTLTITGAENNTMRLAGGGQSSLVVTSTGTKDSLFFDQTVPGQTNVLKEFTVSKSPTGEVSIGNPLVVSGTISPVSGTIVADSNLILASNSNGTAQILAHAIDGNITGNVQVERFLPGNKRKHWRLLGFPYQTSTPLSAISGLSIDFNASSRSMMHYIEKNGDVTPPVGRGAGYMSFTSINDSIPLYSGISAWVYGSQQGLSASAGTLDTEGITVKSYGKLRESGNAVSIPLNYTPGLLTSGWNMISNPFASSIDWSHPSIIKTNVENAKYGWDPEALNWTSHNGLTGTNGSDQIIQSGEGFFVRATATDASISISQNAKTNLATTFSHLGKNKMLDGLTQGIAEQRNKLSGWRLYGSGQGNPVPDQVYIDLTQTDASAGYDKKYDALSMVRTAGVDLSIIDDKGTALSMQFDRPIEAPGKSMRIYPIAVRTPKIGNIIIELEKTGILDDKDRYFLYDKKAGKYVRLIALKTSYTYQASKLYEADRIELHVNPSGIPGASDGDYVRIRNNGNVNQVLQAAIIHQQAKPMKWIITDIQGRILQSGEFESPNEILHTLKLNRMSGGNYHFTVIFSNQERQTNPFIHQ